MDISSDSSDTIILPLNDEPSDTEVENILRKYSSTSSSDECKQATDIRSNVCNVDEFSDEDLIDVPLIKRIRKDDNTVSDSQKPKKDFNFDMNKYNLDGCLNNAEDVKSIVFEKAVATKPTKSCEDILKNLNSKYSTSATNKEYQEDDVVVLSDDSDLDNSSDLSPKKTKERQNMHPSTEKSNHGLSNYPSDDEIRETLEDLSPKAAAKLKKQRELDKKRRDRAREKERRQEEADKKKALKNMEKERKREMLEKQKAMKNALKSAERSTKPDECIKHMIVEIDDEISQKEYGEALKAVLKVNNISFKSKPQPFPKLISWCRKLQTIENMLLINSEVNEKHFLLLMDVSEFSRHTRNNSLTLHLQKITELTQANHLTLAIFGADKPKGDQDFAITEAQMFSKCYFRFVKKGEDFAALVMELTKAVAQIPHKLKKEEANMLHSEYFSDSNKDTVRVDKNGNGLGRLWHQMLTMFPLARLETAEAITAAYPTPSALFKAYDECESKKEELLQNLPIRRALGPCTTVRRIGPELSRKCSNFFCSTENILL